MPSQRQLIDTDKAHLRRVYPATTQGLADLKTLAATYFDADPDNLELTSTGFEGGTGGGQLTGKRDIRRMAIEELIAERDPAYIAPTARLSDRPLGVTVRLGGGYCGECMAG